MLLDNISMLGKYAGMFRVQQVENIELVDQKLFSLDTLC